MLVKTDLLFHVSYRNFIGKEMRLSHKATSLFSFDVYLFYFELYTTKRKGAVYKRFSVFLVLTSNIAVLSFN
jgi:hypothetical protein